MRRLLLYMVVCLAQCIQYSHAVRTNPLQDSCAADESNCCFPSSKWSSDGVRSFRCEPYANGTYPCSVKLGINGWVGAFINVYVAKIFIEEYLGYPVEITADVTDFTGTILEHDELDSAGDVVNKGAWTQLDEGTLDGILEFWPSGHTDNIREYVVERGTIVNAGSNGVEGRIGWFTPSYVLDDHGATLEYWRTLTEQSQAELFTHPWPSLPCCRSQFDQSDDYLPCMPMESLGGTPAAHNGFTNATAECDNTDVPRNISTYGGRFIGGKIGWTQHDAQLLKNLKLNFTQVFAASEDNLLREIERAANTNPQTPTLFYFWRPHGAFHYYDFELKDVLLPLSTAECQALEDSGGSTCGYPIDSLSKAYAKSLESTKPDFALLIGAFAFNSTSQQEIMHAEFMKNPNLSMNNITCSWARENEETWGDWINAVDNTFIDQVWMDETLEPSVVACDCKVDGTRDILSVYQTSAYTEDGSVEIIADPDPCHHRNVSIYKTRWTTLELETTLLKQIPCAYTPKGSRESKIVLALASISWIVFVLCMVALIFYRKNKAVRVARIKTLSLLLFGAVLMNIAQLFEIGPPTTLKCGVRFSFLLFGFYYFVGALLIKQFTINILMRKAYKLDRRRSQRATILIRYDITLCTLFAGMWFALWFGVVGFTPIASVADQLLNVDEMICPTNSTLLMVLVAICYMTIVVSCVLASQTRNFGGLVFNEAKFMLFSNYNVVVLAGLSLFVSLAPGMEAMLKTVFVAFCIFFCTVSCAILIVGSRLFAAGFNLAKSITTATTRAKVATTLAPSITGVIHSQAGSQITTVIKT